MAEKGWSNKKLKWLVRISGQEIFLIPLMPHRKVGTLVAAGVFIHIVRCIDFSLGSQPVSHRITAIEATMFSLEIGGNGNLIVMRG